MPQSYDCAAKLNRAQKIKEWLIWATARGGSLGCSAEWWWYLLISFSLANLSRDYDVCFRHSYFIFFMAFCCLPWLLEVSKTFSTTNTAFLTVKSSWGPGSQQTSSFTRKYADIHRDRRRSALWLSGLHVRHCCCLPQVLDTHIFHSFLRDRLNRKWDAFSRMEQNTRDHVHRCDVIKPEGQSAFQMKQY